MNTSEKMSVGSIQSPTSTAGTQILSLVRLLKVIGIRPLDPVQNNVSLKLMQRKTLNFVINLPDVENITK